MSRITEALLPALPRVRFAVPSWFHRLPMHPDPAERRQALLDLAARVLPHGTREQHWSLAARCDRQAVAVSRYQVLYHGFSFLAAGGRTSMSSLLVGLEPDNHADPASAAERLATQFARDAGEYRQVQRRTLPCGPAVAVLSGAAAPIPTGTGTHTVVPVACVQAVVPIPDAPYLLVIRLTTPSLADWAHYCQAAVAILHSIRFERADDAAAAAGAA